MWPTLIEFRPQALNASPSSKNFRPGYHNFVLIAASKNYALESTIIKEQCSLMSTGCAKGKKNMFALDSTNGKNNMGKITKTQHVDVRVCVRFFTSSCKLWNNIACEKNRKSIYSYPISDRNKCQPVQIFPKSDLQKLVCWIT